MSKSLGIKTHRIGEPRKAMETMNLMLCVTMQGSTHDSPEWSWPKGTARLCTSDCDLVPYPSVTAPWAVGLAAQLGGGHHAAVPWASGWADLEHSGF